MGNANEVVRGRADEQNGLAERGGGRVAHDQEISGEAASGAARRPEREAERRAAQAAAREAAEQARIECAEHLTRDFARVRARFGIDVALAPRSLDAAWTTDVMAEGDEAEFVDTLADCVGAGLPLESALTSWDTGTLVADDADDDDDLAPPLMLAIARDGRRTGRRVYVR
jgi:hypothetical protein